MKAVAVRSRGQSTVPLAVRLNLTPVAQLVVGRCASSSSPRGPRPTAVHPTNDHTAAEPGTVSREIASAPTSPRKASPPEAKTVEAASASAAVPERPRSPTRGVPLHEHLSKLGFAAAQLDATFGDSERMMSLEDAALGDGGGVGAAAFAAEAGGTLADFPEDVPRETATDALVDGVIVKGPRCSWPRDPVPPTVEQPLPPRLGSVERPGPRCELDAAPVVGSEARPGPRCALEVASISARFPRVGSEERPGPRCELSAAPVAASMSAPPRIGSEARPGPRCKIDPAPVAAASAPAPPRIGSEERPGPRCELSAAPVVGSEARPGPRCALEVASTSSAPPRIGSEERPGPRCEIAIGPTPVGQPRASSSSASLEPDAPHDFPRCLWPSPIYGVAGIDDENAAPWRRAPSRDRAIAAAMVDGGFGVGVDEEPLVMLLHAKPYGVPGARMPWPRGGVAIRVAG